MYVPGNALSEVEICTLYTIGSSELKSKVSTEFWINSTVRKSWVVDTTDENSRLLFLNCGNITKLNVVSLSIFRFKVLYSNWILRGKGTEVSTTPIYFQPIQ